MNYHHARKHLNHVTIQTIPAANPPHPQRPLTKATIALTHLARATIFAGPLFITIFLAGIFAILGGPILYDPIFNHLNQQRDL